MAHGTPQALGRRIALLTLFAATLMDSLLLASVAHSQAPPAEGTVRLSPALSNVPGSGGPFTVYIVAENVQHFGTITYDDDRDGTPDRSEQSTGMAAFQVTMEYDPAILEVGGVEPGPDLGRTGRAFQCLPPNRQAGSLTYGCISTGSSTQGAQGTMTLASVQLVPRGPGLSLLSLDAVMAGPLGDGVSVAISGGAARVAGTVQQATATGDAPTGSSNATAQPVQTGTGTTAQTPPAGTASPPATSRPAATPTGGPDDEGERWFGGAAFWLAVLGGGAGAGVLGLAALLWRGRTSRGT